MCLLVMNDLISFYFNDMPVLPSRVDVYHTKDHRYTFPRVFYLTIENETGLTTPMEK